MDMNTIEATVTTANPSDWQPGDAWLAGGTVLFSYGSSVLTRLLDITSAGWAPITVTEQGIELAATCTIAELYELPARAGLLDSWPALALVRPCCESFLASYKIWNMSTVGGNICTALPAGPMTSLTAALDGVATVLTPAGTSRQVPVAELVVGDGLTTLRPGELLRSVWLRAAPLHSRVAFRRLSLSNLGRSGVLLIGRVDADGTLVLTVTASTRHPVQLRFRAKNPNPDSSALRAALDSAIPFTLYHDDIHGLPEWRHDMTYRLAEEIRAELLDDETAREGAVER